MKVKLLPRWFRFFGRVSLAAGAILGVGLATFMIYQALMPEQMGDGGSVVVPSEPPVSGGGLIRTSHVIWLGLMLALVVFGLVITFRQLNDFMRKTIVKIARFVEWPIFGVELALGFLAWGICAVLSLFWLPAGAIMAVAFLVLTELWFVLAWLLYGRPKYKL